MNEKTGRHTPFLFEEAVLGKVVKPTSEHKAPGKGREGNCNLRE
jgi:hypothetical protein